MILEKRKKSTTQTAGWLKYLNRTLEILQITAVFTLGIRLAVMNVLPAGYMAAYAAVMLVIFLLCCFLSARRQSAPAAAVLSGLAICGLVSGFVTVNRIDNTLQKVSSDAGQETVQMAVVVRADDTAEALADMGGKRIGCIKDDGGVPDVKAAVDEAVMSPAVYKEYSDVLALADALLDGRENAVILNSAYTGIISDQDNYEDFSEKIKILYTLEVKVPKAAAGPDTEPGTASREGAALDSDGQEEYKLSSDENTFIVYISGIDTFGSINVKSRSDVNILMALNMETGRMQLVNTPRDYYVTLPDRGPDKLTHAGLYGTDCSREVLEDLYGITVDYYLRINFSGFEEIIDLLGGVDVYSEYDFTVEPIKHYTAGYNHLSGIEALAFARERHSFAEGDVQRGTNQMEVIKAVIAKVVSADMLVNYNEILEEVSECFQTDLPPKVIYDLVRYQLSGSVSWQIDSFTVRGTGSHKSTYSMPGTTSYVMLPDEGDVAEAGRLIGNVLAGETLQPLMTNEVEY